MTATLNHQKVEELAGRVIADMGGAFTMALGYIGDRLGLFAAMRGAGPLTSTQLADRCNLNERYVREWLRAMVSAEYLDVDPISGDYVMTDEQAMVLADEDSPAFCGGGLQFATPTLYNVPRIIDAFRKGGGVPYGEMGSDVPCAIERLFRPGYVNFLSSDWLPAVPGLPERLAAGARVADVGCGRGQSTVAMAQAYPASQFLGIDYDSGSIAASLKLTRDLGITNAEYLQAPADELSKEQPFDLICAFDCIHDMVDPVATLKSIRAAMADDGIYLWSEPNASHDALQNRNPVAKMFQSLSPLHCMTVSLAHDGAGIGTVMGEEGARKLAREAGFSSFEKLPIDNPLNQFFVLRK